LLQVNVPLPFFEVGGFSTFREGRYLTIKGIPNLASLFAELQTQLQAMKTVLRLLDEVPDAVALDTNVISLVGKFGTSCVSVRESIERLWQSRNPDWTNYISRWDRGYRGYCEETALVYGIHSNWRVARPKVRLASCLFGQVYALMSVTVLKVTLPYQLKIGKNTENLLQMRESLTETT
jgi:hypothetical protein